MSEQRPELKCENLKIFSAEVIRGQLQASGWTFEMVARPSFVTEKT